MRHKLLIMLLLCLLVPVTSFASILQQVNGHTYYYGNKNFPFISAGSHAGTFVDISSTVVIANNQNFRVVKLLSTTVYYELKDQPVPDGLVYFKEDKLTRDLSIKWGESDTYRRIGVLDSDARMLVNAYILTRSKQLPCNK